MPRAILSVSDKTGLAGLGRGLAERGWNLILTAGDSERLRAVRDELELLNKIEFHELKQQGTYHTYTQNNKRILKLTHWFRLYLPTDQTGKPAEEEGITQLKWVAPDELENYYGQTYRSIADVLQRL